ncbi:hypothetical protein RCG24_03295 [Neobacillus sp. OS1-32]|jgi:hypothetical protein|uniref:Group-specific protein n=1 Tax=Neobacillus paridis TaxID=2803862 RepID=A0ABS1TS03_9BACI|nr:MULTISPECIES: hypothetical protein [Neobacillus]MBL4953824.1 hypothetical protein [Neobacillus paridis]WML30941.1 hypothetical protein RCG24_03295 [Neobacillus sp. OS1-32]
MFDPTAFDNMKVVIEGAIYDRDLNGEIIITDRNDIINSAKLSREFSVRFTLPEDIDHHLSAQIELVATLDNLAAELLSSSMSEKLAGCLVKLEFFLIHHHVADNYQAIQKLFSGIWGETRKITQTIQYKPFEEPQKVKHIVTIDFARLIREEQMDDLIEMLDFIVKTLKELQVFTI